MSWEMVIGLEVHLQLATQSKIFSGSATAFGAPPNTQANAVDLAMPGMLPVLNAEAVRFAVMFGLGVGAEIGAGVGTGACSPKTKHNLRTTTRPLSGVSIKNTRPVQRRYN